MCLFCRHRNWTAVARFTQNKKSMVVLQCDRCGKYDVMPMCLMQQLRHEFVICVDVRQIDMTYNPYEEKNND